MSIYKHANDDSLKINIICKILLRKYVLELDPIMTSEQIYHTMRMDPYCSFPQSYSVQTCEKSYQHASNLEGLLRLGHSGPAFCQCGSLTTFSVARSICAKRLPPIRGRMPETTLLLLIFDRAIYQNQFIDLEPHAVQTREREASHLKLLAKEKTES